MAKDAKDTIPEAQPTEEMTNIYIDREATDGGIRINDKLYVGDCYVTKTTANELARIQREYGFVKNKLHEPMQKIKIQNHTVIERQYLADPSQQGNNPGYNQEFGLLDPWQWQWIPETEKNRLRKLKEGMYGYKPTK